MMPTPVRVFPGLLLFYAAGSGSVLPISLQSKNWAPMAITVDLAPASESVGLSSLTWPGNETATPDLREFRSCPGNSYHRCRWWSPLQPVWLVGGNFLET